MCSASARKGSGLTFQCSASVMPSSPSCLGARFPPLHLPLSSLIARLFEPPHPTPAYRDIHAGELIDQGTACFHSLLGWEAVCCRKCPPLLNLKGSHFVLLQKGGLLCTRAGGVLQDFIPPTLREICHFCSLLAKRRILSPHLVNCLHVNTERNRKAAVPASCGTFQSVTRPGDGQQGKMQMNEPRKGKKTR